VWLSVCMSARLLPHLNERQRRLAVAAEASAAGRGGVSAVYRGLAELDGRYSSRDGQSRPGAGANGWSDRSRVGRGVGRSDQWYAPEVRQGLTVRVLRCCLVVGGRRW